MQRAAFYFAKNWVGNCPPFPTTTYALELIETTRGHNWMRYGLFQLISAHLVFNLMHTTTIEGLVFSLVVKLPLLSFPNQILNLVWTFGRLLENMFDSFDLFLTMRHSVKSHQTLLQQLFCPDRGFQRLCPWKHIEQSQTLNEKKGVSTCVPIRLST